MPRESWDIKGKMFFYARPYIDERVDFFGENNIKKSLNFSEKIPRN